jgi:hypothetical protein
MTNTNYISKTAADPNAVTPKETPLDACEVEIKLHESVAANGNKGETGVNVLTPVEDTSLESAYNTYPPIDYVELMKEHWNLLGMIGKSLTGREADFCRGPRVSCVDHCENTLEMDDKSEK